MRCVQSIFALTAIVLAFGCGKDDPTGPCVPDPVASFTESGGTVAPATIAFTNTSQNAHAYVWRFGDGNSTTVASPIHVFNTHGDYSVSLTARNNSTGRTDTESKILAIAPGAVFVEGIAIKVVPFTDAYGAGWDLSSRPDLYVDLVNSAYAPAYESPTYYLDVAPSDLPLSWEMNVRLTDWANPYFVRAWDYDDLSENDYIGAPNGFWINDFIASGGYVTAISRSNSSSTMGCAISLRWQ